MPEDETDWGVNPTTDDNPERLVLNADLPAFVQADKPFPEIHQLPDAESRELRGDELPIPGVHYVVFEGKEWAVTRRTLLTEDDWVRGAVQATRDYVRVHDIRDRRLTEKGTYQDVPVQGRLDRAAQYASWRYRGYLAGEVSSL